MSESSNYSVGTGSLEFLSIEGGDDTPVNTAIRRVEGKGITMGSVRPDVASEFGLTKFPVHATVMDLLQNADAMKLRAALQTNRGGVIDAARSGNQEKLNGLLGITMAE